ncbi:hypothetical protein IEQ34_021341 [Dendrobium chrysotoxum]|uniref:Uncharacterized protein n=1 Tax=Dendrobium chrysotoxum TaxID=161865 RepID=A0AAV7G4V9_DENCH|nr:hypothetical protein IEQ34_021341 [Dendrobium chrysotoxum]
MAPLFSLYLASGVGNPCSLQSQERHLLFISLYYKPNASKLIAIRMSGRVRFEVHACENLLLSGILELLMSTDLRGEPKKGTMKWSMKCQPIMSDGSFFLKGKQYMSPEATLQIIELGIQKRNQMRLALDSIRENGAPGVVKEELHKEAQQRMNYVLPIFLKCLMRFLTSSYAMALHQKMMWTLTTIETWKDLTWFNAGVRVGVGLGHGISLGIGIEVGLLMHFMHANVLNANVRCYNQGANIPAPNCYNPIRNPWKEKLQMSFKTFLSHLISYILVLCYLHS